MQDHPKVVVCSHLMYGGLGCMSLGTGNCCSMEQSVLGSVSPWRVSSVGWYRCALAAHLRSVLAKVSTALCRPYETFHKWLVQKGQGRVFTQEPGQLLGCAEVLLVPGHKSRVCSVYTILVLPSTCHSGILVASFP